MRAICLLVLFASAAAGISTDLEDETALLQVAEEDFGDGEVEDDEETETESPCNHDTDCAGAAFMCEPSRKVCLRTACSGGAQCKAGAVCRDNVCKNLICNSAGKCRKGLVCVSSTSTRRYCIAPKPSTRSVLQRHTTRSARPATRSAVQKPVDPRTPYQKLADAWTGKKYTPPKPSAPARHSRHESRHEERQESVETTPAPHKAPKILHHRRGAPTVRWQTDQETTQTSWRKNAEGKRVPPPPFYRIPHRVKVEDVTTTIVPEGEE